MLKLLFGLIALAPHWSVDGRSGGALWRILPAYHGPLIAGIFLVAVSGCELLLVAAVFWQLIFAAGFLMLQRRCRPAAVPA